MKSKNERYLVVFENTTYQWRFCVGVRGHRPPNLAQAPKIFQFFGSIVNCLVVVAFQTMRGTAPNIFLRTATATHKMLFFCQIL